MVAAQAHQKGSNKSATSPSSVKTIQNIFFCMGTIVVAGQRQHSKPLPQGVNAYGDLDEAGLTVHTGEGNSFNLGLISLPDRSRRRQTHTGNRAR
jgi:hypothetical protein